MTSMGSRRLGRDGGDAARDGIAAQQAGGVDRRGPGSSTASLAAARSRGNSPADQRLQSSGAVKPRWPEGAEHVVASRSASVLWAQRSSTPAGGGRQFRDGAGPAP